MKGGGSKTKKDKIGLVSWSDEDMFANKMQVFSLDMKREERVFKGRVFVEGLKRI